jgi:AmmeMemoRadiSam system protein B
VRPRILPLSVLLVVLCASAVHAGEVHPSVRDLLDNVGIKPTLTQRGQVDTVGFVTRAGQMDSVLAQCDTLAAPQRRLLEERQAWAENSTLVAAVCPHDDYYYAGRLYSLLLPHVRARTVVVFGVFHKARLFACRDKIVFDSYPTWRGPYGPVKVSPLRERILRELPEDDYVVSNDMHMVEHSVEALVPFLQAYNRDVEIVPILVPYMDWTTLGRLAGDIAGALARVIEEKGWTLGEDICLIASSDAVHYGDSEWGGSNYAEFGADAHGYQMAVERDIAMAERYLCGEIDRAALKQFMYECVDPDDVMKYRITWCGRFSVPFGIDVAARLIESAESRRLEGVLFDYGTSVSEASLGVDGLDGLGPTAPNNFHHWVGYAAIAYR